MFKPYAYGDGNVTGYEYLAASAMGEIGIGTAMVVTNGLLAKATGAVKPTYVSTGKRNVEEGDIIPVIRAKESTRFATTFSADAAAVNVGDKLTISADGTEVTATTGGCCEVVEIRGENKGDEVIVRFVGGDK